MGFLDLENKGNGFIGPLGDGWSMQYNTSPAILGTGKAKLGSLNFSTRCDDTTKFTIDNYLSVKHYWDNQVSRLLSSFDVNVRSVSLTNEFASFNTISRLSQLDVIRQSNANPTGTYQRKLTPPSGKPYTISATPYTTPANARVYDIAQEGFYIYVLASGAHGGEVVHVYGSDGVWNKVWPVHSDATDLANPGSTYLAYATGWLMVAQVGADRVKRFVAFTGVFVNQFGTAGVGNSQFDTISAIAANGTSIYVGDSAIGRVQRFSVAGTYVSQFGAAGSGSGAQEFLSLNSVNVNSSDTALYVGDNRARIREFTVAGGFISNGFGGWDFTLGVAYGPFTAFSRIDISFDGIGNAYAVQSGVLYKFTHDMTAYPNSTWQDGPRLVQTVALPIDSQIAMSDEHGIAHVVSSDGLSAIQYAGSTTTLYSYLLYYLALAAGDFPCRFLSLNDPELDGNPIVLPEWEMSVWEAITELCAATGNVVMAFDDSIHFMNRTTRGTFSLPDEFEMTELDIDTSNSGRRVQVVSQNAVRTSGPPGIMYSTRLDGQKTFSADVGSVDTVVVSQDTYPEYLIQPLPQGPSVNPFANPSVEVNLTNLGYFSPSGVYALTRDTTSNFALHGIASAKLTFSTAPTATGSYISNRIDVNPGQAYDFRIWASCTGAAQKVILFVDYRNSADQNVGWDAGPSMNITSTGWYEIRSQTPQVPPPGTTYAYVELRHASDGRAWLNGEALFADAWSDGWFYGDNGTDPIASPGRYTVYDGDNVLVDPVKWVNHGGRVTAERGAGPGEIVITIYGPGIQIPGTQAPYSIRETSGLGSLSILGGGVICQPETLEIGTGVPESVTNREVAGSMDSPFSWNDKVAYSEGVWMAYRAAINQSFTVTIPMGYAPIWVDSGGGTGGSHTLIGSIVRYRDALYIIEEIRANAYSITLDLVLHTSWGERVNGGVQDDPYPDNIWSGKTCGDFDAFWVDYTAQDFMIAPLRNPYSV